jgi:hypothetical protein
MDLAEHWPDSNSPNNCDTWEPAGKAGNRVVLRLAYCLRAFLETAEQEFCPRWPLRTPGVPKFVADAAVEYRAERWQP